jgi:hypothetical protein
VPSNYENVESEKWAVFGPYTFILLLLLLQRENYILRSFNEENIER